MQDFTLPELGPYVRGKPGERQCLEGERKGEGECEASFWVLPPSPLPILLLFLPMWVFIFFVLSLPPLEPTHVLCSLMVFSPRVPSDCLQAWAESLCPFRLPLLPSPAANPPFPNIGAQEG